MDESHAADIRQKIGAAASTIVKSLVYIAQLIYKGLVALVTFLANLAPGSSKRCAVETARL